jgi:hypothetical protein
MHTQLIQSMRMCYILRESFGALLYLYTYIFRESFYILRESFRARLYLYTAPHRDLQSLAISTQSCTLRASELRSIMAAKSTEPRVDCVPQGCIKALFTGYYIYI